MEWQFFISIAMFAIVMTGTPGPNNVMLTASGANFGYRRSLPHAFGIGVGLMSMILLLASGLGLIFQQYPVIQDAMKWVGSSYLFYLAWKIANAKPVSEHGDESSKPMTFVEAALFQYLNPKAWMMMVTAIGSFSLQGNEYWWSILVIAVIFWITQIQTSSIWVGFGTLIGRWLSSTLAWRRFNLCMGSLTAICVVFIW
ncbi:LysE family translocator [Vibrio sp. VB16]|jgi:threonine/homoserine/homoserine lactone efflux protein|uniref:LysE family translocator n=1 Tax=Vibrio sp. VB16 TaxID=2785746 RepID=UPI0018A0B5EA|nr:LysE family translocator [Vibrio sp. VB16]UGA54588.1 LysE family translocator [Vibrio sp. VB16]